MLNQLLNEIKSYLNHQSTLKELDTWLISHLQEILDSKDERAINIANQVDADIVEFGEGLVDDITLQERFKNYRDTVSVIWNVADEDMSTHISTGTSSRTVKNRMEDLPVKSLHLVYAA